MPLGPSGAASLLATACGEVSFEAEGLASDLELHSQTQRHRLDPLPGQGAGASGAEASSDQRCRSERSPPWSRAPPLGGTRRGAGDLDASPEAALWRTVRDVAWVPLHWRWRIPAAECFNFPTSQSEPTHLQQLVVTMLTPSDQENLQDSHESGPPAAAAARRIEPEAGDDSGGSPESHTAGLSGDEARARHIEVLLACVQSGVVGILGVPVGVDVPMVELSMNSMTAVVLRDTVKSVASDCGLGDHELPATLVAPHLISHALGRGRGCSIEILGSASERAKGQVAV